jgi:hypothetical protein
MQKGLLFMVGLVIVVAGLVHLQTDPEPLAIGAEGQAAKSCLAQDPRPGSPGTYPIILTVTDRWGQRRVDFHFCESASAAGQDRIVLENILSVDYIMLFGLNDQLPSRMVTAEDADFSIWCERLDAAVKELLDRDQIPFNRNKITELPVTSTLVTGSFFILEKGWKLG